MKPAMKEKVTLLVPKVEDGERVKDDFGQFEYEEIETKARVTRETKVKQGGEHGQYFLSNMEVDLPPEVYVEKGFRLRYVDEHDIIHEGVIETVDEARSFAGNKIYYRSVEVA